MAARKKVQKRKTNNTKEKPPKRREIGAVVCLFLGICSVFGYFSSNAWFIKFVRTLGTGLFGLGFYILPICLIGCAYILAFHKGRPVRLRVTCTLLIVPVLGIILHLALCRIDYEWSGEIIKLLYRDGTALQSGGVISGILAVALVKMLGLVCGVIIVALLLVILSMAALRITPAAIIDFKKSHPKREYVPMEEEKVSKRPPQKTEYVPEARDTEFSAIKKVIDIPVDDPPLAEKKKTTLFNRSPGCGNSGQGFFRLNLW